MGVAAVAAKKAPAKKAVSKQTRKRTTTKRSGAVPGGEVEVVDGGGVNPPVNPPMSEHIDIEEVIREREEYAERWAEAWRLSAIGIPVRQIGTRMGVSHTVAARYIRKHQMLVWGDPNLVEQRGDVLTRLDQIIDNMTREITTLDAAQREKPAGARLPVWLEHGDKLMKALQAKWAFITPNEGRGKVQVEVGVIPGGGGQGDRDGMRLPPSLQAVLATVTVSSDDGQ